MSGSFINRNNNRCEYCRNNTNIEKHRTGCPKLSDLEGPPVEGVDVEAWKQSPSMSQWVRGRNQAWRDLESEDDECFAGYLCAGDLARNYSPSFRVGYESAQTEFESAIEQATENRYFGYREY